MKPDRTKIAFIFSSCSSQYLDMGRRVRRAFPEVEKNLQVINKTLGYNLASAMKAPNKLLLPKAGSPSSTLHSMEVIVALSLAVARSLSEAGIKPDVVAGNSLGEFSAAVFAKVFGVPECFSMFQTVTLPYLQDCFKNPRARAATIYGLSRVELKGVSAGMAKSGQICEMSIFFDRLRKGVLGLRNEGANMLKCRLTPFNHKIKISGGILGALHTSLSAHLVDWTRNFFTDIAFHSPTAPLYMNLDGNPETAPAAIKHKLASMLSRPVLWQESLNRMIADGVTTFVEIAPRAMLTEFICDLPPDAEVLRTDTPENYFRTLDSLLNKRPLKRHRPIN
ncbi:MAG: hypothetical protein A2X34_03175 [Elusimicrobia bacterium GWC2_51_8]|nr:MAG: hypothetical protein A2X33_06075 [Elusimicrobia bacterium GWA2_51_34]OGR61971.1 MAG: hypothetical protein A2X34_03175 [Elusimicrobia bacterium GWC2_51_8]OGR85197.1 MAG: hypothetical protein A2021_00440 [Elusimicrobia bacterium GWF2_52_66]HAF94764.1 hypothetical protein [Elusimicrobiota bacterium]HCE97625.1 hypothetical protein [Elusimicrobiota bacterium]